MQTLVPFTDEMRALGIRRLTIELEPAAPPPREALDLAALMGEARADRPTDAPPVEKGPGVCIAAGCSNQNGGVFGAATEYCETHALAAAGVK